MATTAETNDFSLFSSPFDLTASLGSGSSASSDSCDVGDSGSERGEASPLPSQPQAQQGSSAAAKASHGATIRKCAGHAPPRVGVPSNAGGQASRHKYPIFVPAKSHLKPHVNHSQSRMAPHCLSPQHSARTSPLERPRSLPAPGARGGSSWYGHPRGVHHHTSRTGALPPNRATSVGVADGEEQYRIMISSPLSSPLSRHREFPTCGDGDLDSLIDGMGRMSMHNIHDEPRVVDISPASGYYEARKPRLRNGGLNARLYNAFRVTTRDHLSINTRSPSLRGGTRNANSFSSDVSMSAGNSPYAGAMHLGSGSPLGGGWDTSGDGPPNFTLEGGGANRSFNKSYGSSLSFPSGSISFDQGSSPGPRLGSRGLIPPTGGGSRSGNSAPTTPALPPPFSPVPGGGGTPMSSNSLPPGADIRDVMAIHGTAAAAAAAAAGAAVDGSGMMSPLSPTPPFGIKYKTELCLNWINTGTCVYGNKCHFGHGDNDLRARKRVRNFKTQMCCDPAREGARRCMFNARCNFLHPSEPLRRAEPVPYFDEDYFGMLMRDFPGNDYPFGIYV